MLKILSELSGYALDASDGRIGTVRDFLFDDNTWKVRWLVVDTGTWLTSRKVLIHPSAIKLPVHGHEELQVALTMQQVMESPSTFDDLPVSQQMETNLYDYYGWDPMWGGGYFGGVPNAIASPLSPPPLFGGTLAYEAANLQPETGRDPHLRSFATVTGYRIHATNGEIGHVENLLIDDANWEIRYLVVDTRNWWSGKHVLMSPYAVEAISWGDGEFKLNVTRDQVRSGPTWKPTDLIDDGYEQWLHSHYGWPGYGWRGATPPSSIGAKTAGK